jgi:hypothetical protein
MDCGKYLCINGLCDGACNMLTGWQVWNLPVVSSRIPLRLVPNVRNARSPASTLVYVHNECSIEQHKNWFHRVTQAFKLKQIAEVS